MRSSATQGAELNKNSVVAPMPGTLVKVFAKVGDKVAEGKPILIMEAMKMEVILACYYILMMNSIQ